MPGLPPVPDDVLHVVFVVDVDGSPYTLGWWYFVPSLAAGGLPWLVATAGQIVFGMLGPVTGCMHDGASLVTCRLESGGVSSLRYDEPVAPNHGAYTGGQADCVASGVYVVSSGTGRGSGSRIRIPGCPDDFVHDGNALAQAGAARLRDFCDGLVSTTASLSPPVAGSVVLGTLQRKTASGPRAVSSFDPAAGVIPSLRVERLGRRLPRSGRLSSS